MGVQLNVSRRGLSIAYFMKKQKLLKMEGHLLNFTSLEENTFVQLVPLLIFYINPSTSIALSLPHIV